MRIVVLLVCCFLFSFTSCFQSNSGGLAATGVIDASVILTGSFQPEAGKRIQIQETGKMKITDASGHVLFSAAPGTYTVRAFEIGTPGPGRPYIDSVVVVKLAETARITFVDCPQCY